MKICKTKEHCLTKIIIFMKKIDLKSVKIALDRDEMEEIVGGCGSCGTVTGGFCTATIFLCYAGPLACLAAATGIGCAIGLYAGCYK